MKGSWGYIAALMVGVILGSFAYQPFIAVPTAQAQILSPEQKAKLQAEYDQLQLEIAQWQKVLDTTRAKKKTLTGDVTALDAQIKKAQKEIQQRTISITTLGSEIIQKTAAITTLEQKLAAGKESLAKLMREKNEMETIPLALLALSADSLSGFFADVQSIDTINQDMQDRFAELRGVKAETQKEKEALDARKAAELDARYEVQQKQNQIKENQQEKQQLLAVTKKDEQSYQAVLSERQKRANVGQCLLTDPATGAGKGKNSGTPINKVMKPDRDVQPFLDLMSRLGADPYNTPVSCPQSVGYGGAMGPSQFIASTWKLYEKRIAAAAGVSVADPWSPKQAVMATALFLRDLGASKQTYSAEREAAGRYYAGANWKRSGLSYAASVLSFAEKYQKDIDFLKEN